MPNAMQKLTPKQKAFVIEYLVDLNATQAAIRAGYKESRAKETGYRLVTKGHIAAAIQAGMDERSKRTEITQNYVLSTIKETVERCRQVQQVFDKSGAMVMVETLAGELAPAFVFDAKNVLKGCELLGKHLEMFTGKGKDDDETPQPTKVEIIVTDARKPSQ